MRGAEAGGSNTAGEQLGPHLNRLRCLLYALTFLSATQQMSIAPVLPYYVHRFGLSGIEEGVLVAATAFATLAVSVPAGALCDRLGARRLTLFAGVAMVLAALLQHWPRPRSRLSSPPDCCSAPGTGSCGPPAWPGCRPPHPNRPASAAPSSSPGRVGFSVPSPSASAPSTSVWRCRSRQWQSSWAWPRWPWRPSAFLPGAVEAGARVGEPAHRPRRPFDDRRHAGPFTVAGMSSGFATLLVPFVFHAAGGTAGEIGLAFSAAAVTFVLGSVVTERLGSRAVRGDGGGRPSCCSS